MSLELLPNEILLDTFSYFTGVELLRTFYALNSRLNSVLHEQFYVSSFKFDSISKHDFDIICQQHLLQIAKYMTVLQLSDHEQTPTAIQLFLSSIQSFHMFKQLKSLSFSHLRSYESFSIIIDRCFHLDKLTDLKFDSCYFDEMNLIDFQSIIDRIWCLANLRHCSFGFAIRGLNSFPIPKHRSISLESLFIEKIQLKLDQINQLIEQTPNLQTLSISIRRFTDNNYVPMVLLNLTSLHIHSIVNCNASNMSVLLENTPNLRCLSVNLLCEIINGHQLKDIIRNHLKNLEILRLKMKFLCPSNETAENRVGYLMNSFQDRFWIDEHQWFVRSLISNCLIYLYTTSEYYEDDLPIRFQSTNLIDNEKQFYDTRITKLTCPIFFEQSYRLSNLRTLEINLPLNDRFWSIMTNFDRLKSLTVLLHTNAFQSQVQELLNRTVHLKKFSIKQHESTPLPQALFKYKHQSIQELDLRYINHFFSPDECAKLCQSPLGNQCHVLSILVKNCASIEKILDRMPKIRALNVRCKERQEIDWFRKQLPMTCSINRDWKNSSNLVIWI